MNRCTSCGNDLDYLEQEKGEICQDCIVRYQLTRLPVDLQYYELAKIFQKDDSEKALACLAKMKVKHAEAYVLEGEIYEHSSRFSEAKECYEKAIALYPNLYEDDRITVLIGKSYLQELYQETDAFRRKQLGQKAVHYLKRFDTRYYRMMAKKNCYLFSERNYKNRYSRLFDVARIYVESGNYSRAIVQLREVLEMLPPLEELLYYTLFTGKVLLEEENDGTKQDGHAYFRMTALQSHLLMAQCYAMVGQEDKALHHVEAVLYLESEHTEALQMYEQLLNPLGKNALLVKNLMEKTFHQVEKLLHNQTTELKQTIYEVRDELAASLTDQHTYYTELIEDIERLLESHHIEMSEVVGLTLEQVQEMKQDLTEFMSALNTITDIRKSHKHLQNDELFELLAEMFAKQEEKFLGSFGEKKESYEHLLQKEFGKYWDVLCEDSKRFLITSEIIFQSYKYYRGIDFSPAVIPLTKAIEREMKEKLFQPLRKYCDRTYSKHPSISTVKKHVPKGLYTFKNGEAKRVTNPTMGSYYNILSGGEKTLNLLKAAGVLKEGTLETKEELHTLYETLKEIAFKRNSVCHAEGITIDYAEELREIIVWEKKFLRKFLGCLSLNLA